LGRGKYGQEFLNLKTEKSEKAKKRGGMQSNEKRPRHKIDEGNTIADDRVVEKRTPFTPIPKPNPVIKRGVVRVQKYFPNDQRKHQTYPNTRDVLIHSSNVGFGGHLSPFHLRDDRGRIMENVWQFAKLYRKVEAQCTPMSRRWEVGTIIWEHPEEVHTSGDPDDIPNEAYWAWRAKGMTNKYAVRYPNGYAGRHLCLCHVTDDGEKLSYIEARKRIYCAFYIQYARTKGDFLEMKRILGSGMDVQIREVDGPDYTLKHPPYNTINERDRGMIMTEEHVRLLLDDPIKPFGHGFVIAALLMDGGERWLE
jgi:hypothetical protein